MKEFVKLQATLIRTSSIKEVKFEHQHKTAISSEYYQIVIYHFEERARCIKYYDYNAFKRDSDALENTLLEIEPAPKAKKTSKKKQGSVTDNN